MQVQIEKSKLTLSQRTYELFNETFIQLYTAFSKGKKSLIVHNGMSHVEASPEVLNQSYYHTRRILANLHQAGLVKVIWRKPDKPEDWKPGDKVYSYREVYPTEKGFEAFEKGMLCPVVASKAYRSLPEEDVSRADKVGIGKPYQTYEQLLKKYWGSAVRKKYKVAQTRFYEWTKEFDDLYSVTLACLKEAEAVTEIQKLIERLVPTLPNRQTVQKIQAELKEVPKLATFF